MLDYDLYLLSLTFPLLLGGIYFWGSQILFDGGSIAFHEDCCCEDECSVCDEGTWSSWSTATVTLTGTPSDDFCEDCDDWIGSWSLTEKNALGCYVCKSSGLPCQNTADPLTDGAGYNDMCLYWTLVEGNDVVMALVISYQCLTQSGFIRWTSDTIEDAPVDCSSSYDFGTSSTEQHNCTSFYPCDLNSLSASVVFS